MTSSLLKYVLSAILYVHLMKHTVFAEQTPPATSKTLTTTIPTTVPKNPSNRFLKHLVKKYGSQGKISFEGFEHLMHNLGIGDLALKHPLDIHRPNGYKVSEVIYDEESSTIQIDAETVTESETTTATSYAADSDYNLIKLINTFDNDKKEDIFRTMHDTNHRHPRHRDHLMASKKTCLSPITLIQMYSPDQFNNTHKNNPIYRSEVASEHDDHEQHHHQHVDHDDHNEFTLSNIQISPSDLLNMCPALLVQIEQGSCADGATEPTMETYKETPEIMSHKTSGEISGYSWILAIGSNTVICLCGLIGICMVPLSKFRAYHDILRFMIAVAIGTLVGDALMHLIPHALMPHKHSNSNSPNKMNIEARHASHDHGTDNHETINEHEAVLLLGCAFATAFIMYFIESIIPLVSVNGGHGHSHSIGHPHHLPSNKVQSENSSCEDLENDIENPKKNNEENVMVKDTNVRPIGSLTPSAFMVVIGDGLHNLTDGMAIGGAFGVDPVTGLATAVAVLLHELPHELGDFALLLQTGVSIRRAFVFNFISSVLSFIGIVSGLLIVNANSELVKWIYTGTAGTFMYIAFADLIPELARAEQSIRMCIVQALGIAFGGGIMLLIGLYEENLSTLFEFTRE